MSDLRRVVSPSQVELLLQYMERHPALALAGSRSRYDQLLARKLWEKVARTLNKVDGKVVKTGKGWCRYWADLKCKTRRKHSSPHGRRSFTPLELRIVDLLTDEHGNLLPNAHQQADKEYQINTKPSTKKIKRSQSDEAQDSSQESDIQTHEQTDKIYIINHTEHTNGHKNNINIENLDKNLNERSSRENYSAKDHNNIADDQYSNPGHIYIPGEGNNSATELNSRTDVQNYIRTRQKNSALEHNGIEEQNNSTTEFRTKKTIEELRKEMLEFQLKRQKELFELEKRERNERHKLEMDILRLKRDILVKELNNLT